MRELARNRCLTPCSLLLFLLFLVSALVVALFAFCRLLVGLFCGGRGSLSVCVESKQ